MYSLCYLPTAGRMTLTVIRCRNLKAMDITGSSGKPRDSGGVRRSGPVLAACGRTQKANSRVSQTPT